MKSAVCVCVHTCICVNVCHTHSCCLIIEINLYYLEVAYFGMHELIVGAKMHPEKDSQTCMLDLCVILGELLFQN